MQINSNITKNPALDAVQSFKYLLFAAWSQNVGKAADLIPFFLHVFAINII